MRGSKKKRSVITERAGRNIRIVHYRQGENTLAPLPTIINALFNGKYDFRDRKFTIDKNDFVGWDRLERESLTLIMVIDVSHSTFPCINIFAEIINSLTGYFKLHQDRIGLISLQGIQAKIMNHPTHNYRIVTRNLLKLKVHGETPLADGLQKAIAMVKLEKYRKPGSRNMVILLSDCCPEPITGKYQDFLDEPAYRESIRAAALCKKHKMSLLVINPSFANHDEANFNPGEKLSTTIARVSGGKLIKLYRSAGLQEQNIYTAPTDHEIRMVISSVEEMLGQRGLSEGMYGSRRAI